MEEGFLFDGIDVGGTDAGVNQRVVSAAAVFADTAVAALMVVDDAFARAQLALSLLVGQFLIEARFDDELRVVGRGLGWGGRRGAHRQAGQGSGLEKCPAVHVQISTFSIRLGSLVPSLCCASAALAM